MDIKTKKRKELEKRYAKILILKESHRKIKLHCVSTGQTMIEFFQQLSEDLKIKNI